MISDQEAADNLAANILRLLQQRDWSQTDLARLTGESENNISRIARGLNVAKIGLLARIAEAFDVSSDRLLMPPPEIIPEIESATATEG